MSELSAMRGYRQVADLRQATFELLEQQMERGGQDPDQDVITALQDAANRLGAAERALFEAVSEVWSRPSATDESPETRSSEAAQECEISAAVAIALALAETLVPLAPSRADEAERWLRIMREHGHVGNALAELGMTSGQLATPADEPRPRGRNHADPVTVVAQAADGFARDRDAPAVTTADLLFAVILEYGPLFDRALYGATRRARDDLLTALSQPELVA
jgi:hypothetical protein